MRRPREEMLAEVINALKKLQAAIRQLRAARLAVSAELVSSLGELRRWEKRLRATPRGCTIEILR